MDCHTSSNQAVFVRQCPLQSGLKYVQASDGDVSPYVKFILDDPQKVKPEMQHSTLMHHEPCPHYNQKFDFAMISGTSTLTAHVYDKKTALQAVFAHPVKTLAGKVTGMQTIRLPSASFKALDMSAGLQSSHLKLLYDRPEG